VKNAHFNVVYFVVQTFATTRSIMTLHHRRTILYRDWRCKEVSTDANKPYPIDLPLVNG